MLLNPYEMGKATFFGRSILFYDNEEYLIPTLSELIEACGEGFAQIKKCDKYWRCYVADETGEAEFYRDGTTPKEAVANLWLAQNKKKK